ncbi:LysE family translocator [Enterobacillus tribolii]|uniref:Threonine/homoserine/homoserine lactone efflux protein n=1 Tax=Enterobacillus tribolii TaxID=1487935 RepID=A0A370QN43_9GAMM|nr:LysE family transporter [Enterobacillus tribolii]MBW7982290.1 LysE family translocator [Enterobacillus tribolii]RDK89460.1 threonine/homoserine/homoserine lactone efflux protein [Enterobacillus tribolii]
MDSSILALISVAGVIALGAMAPGPSFILVARTTMSSSLRDGLAAAMGMGVGCAFFAVLALFGLQSLLLAVPWLYASLKVVGGFYLIYLAVKMFRSATTPLTVLAGERQQTHWRRSFCTGLITQLSNPNTALVFGGIFAALLTQHIASWMYVALPLMSFTIDMVWYAFVAFVLSASGPRAVYLRFKAWFDRMGGAMMALLGLKLIVQR